MHSERTTPKIDMAKVTAAVAHLDNPAADRLRRACAFHDLPPVDAHRRTRVANLNPDASCGFDNPDFLH